MRSTRGVYREQALSTPEQPWSIALCSSPVEASPSGRSLFSTARFVRFVPSVRPPLPQPRPTLLPPVWPRGPRFLASIHPPIHQSINPPSARLPPHQSNNPIIHQSIARLPALPRPDSPREKEGKTGELLQNSYGTPSEVHRSLALSTSEHRAGNALATPTSDHIDTPM